MGWWIIRLLLHPCFDILQFVVKDKRSGVSTYAQDCVTATCQMHNKAVHLRSTLICLVRNAFLGFGFYLGGTCCQLVSFESIFPAGGTFGSLVAKTPLEAETN